MPAVRRAVPPLVAAALALGGCGGVAVRTVTERVTVRADGTPYRPLGLDWPAGHPWRGTAAATILAGLPEALGRSPRVRYVGLYDGYVVAFVLDDRVPGHVDDWTWRDGRWRGSPMSSIDPASARTEAFTLDATAFARVPAVLAVARTAGSAVEDAALSCIALQRDGSRDGQLTWSVSLTAPRESPTYRFALDGTPLPEG